MSIRRQIFAGVALLGLAIAGSATGACVSLIQESTAQAAVASDRLTPLQIVERGFERVLDYPSVRSLRLRVVRGERLRTLRVFDVVYRRFDGKGHTLLRFREPNYLRNQAMLIIENPDGSSDAFLYRPEDTRPRRVSARQKADSFFGTDLTFEDLEHHRWETYGLRLLARERDSASHYLIEAIPPRGSHYSRLSIEVEKKRLAVTKVSFYRGVPERLEKTLTVELADKALANGCLRPSTMRMRNARNDGYTDAEFTKIVVNEEITKRAFTMMRLQNEGEDLFELVERMRGEGR